MAYRRYGGPEVIAAVDLPSPRASAQHVLIRARATSINPVDWKMASGKLWPILRADFPCIPGFDVAGEVVDPGGSALRPGARVHARIEHPAAAAELVAAEVAQTVEIPAAMSWHDAAALPLAGQTALQALRDDCGLPMRDARRRVLVIGASGGVGHIAAQIAVAAGAEVAGVCSARNVETVRALGVASVIDYTSADPYAGHAPFDLVLDCVGGDVAPFRAMLTPTGTYASVVPGPGTFGQALLNPLRGQKVRAVLLKPSAEKLRFLDELYERGQLRVLIDRVVPLDQLAAAWERSISGRAVGKVVVEIG